MVVSGKFGLDIRISNIILRLHVPNIHKIHQQKSLLSYFAGLKFCLVFLFDNPIDTRIAQLSNIFSTNIPIFYNNDK